MPKSLSPGKCRLCGRVFDKPRMTNHLKACLKRAAPAAPAKAKTTEPARCFHIVVEATYAPDYWLHLEVPADAIFAELDAVLRNIWLECCWHMSAFQFPRKHFLPMPTATDLTEMFAELLEHAQRNFEQQTDEEERLMDVPLGERLGPGVKFEYEYDFGWTTHLSLRVVAERPCSLPEPKIRLLARNEPPDIRCARCKKPATRICAECTSARRDGAVCKRCAANHECGKEALLPVINSPRTGVCGYCGPSIEP